MVNKVWKTIGMWGAIVGGAVHVLQPLKFDVLSWFGAFAVPVQIAVGALTIWFVWAKK